MSDLNVRNMHALRGLGIAVRRASGPSSRYPVRIPGTGNSYKGSICVVVIEIIDILLFYLSTTSSINRQPEQLRVMDFTNAREANHAVVLVGTFVTLVCSIEHFDGRNEC